MIMKKSRKSAKPVSADAIARLADRGKDISSYFKSRGRMIRPVQQAKAEGKRTGNLREAAS